MFNKSFIVWLASVLLALASGHLYATQVDRVTLDEAIRDAGLIFQGTVIKIESRIATDMGPNYAGEYYAFVTFRVERIMKGQIEGDNVTTFTLPFQSCLVLDYNKQKSVMEQNPALSATEAAWQLQPAMTMTEQPGVYMGCGITGMPHFIVGESDILFVGADYAGAMCPLIGWWQGRYSIVNNKIYPVAWLTKEGGVDFTAPYGLEDEQDAEKRGEALPQEAKKQGWTPLKGAKRIGPDEFAEVIERKLRSLEQTQFMAGKQKLAPVKSADFNDPIYYKSAKWQYEEAQKYKETFKKMYPNGIQQGK